jgi:hypothetical protein
MGLLDSSTYLVLSKSPIQKNENAKAAFRKFFLGNNHQVWLDVLWWMLTPQQDIYSPDRHNNIITLCFDRRI